MIGGVKKRMINDNLLSLQAELKSLGMLICFSGYFSQGIIEELGEAVKQHMENESRTKGDIFNVLSVFIEQSQNIRNYANSKQGQDCFQRVSESGIVVIGKSEPGYYICSGNYVHNDDLPPLLARIDRLAGMDKEQLKKLYKEKLHGALPEGGGAGLGLINIARKTSAPLQYRVEKREGAFSFFTLEAIS
jgi:hypothetical protein